MAPWKQRTKHNTNILILEGCKYLKMA